MRRTQETQRRGTYTPPIASLNSTQEELAEPLTPRAARSIQAGAAPVPALSPQSVGPLGGATTGAAASDSPRVLDRDGEFRQSMGRFNIGRVGVSRCVGYDTCLQRGVDLWVCGVWGAGFGIITMDLRSLLLGLWINRSPMLQQQLLLVVVVGVRPPLITPRPVTTTPHPVSTAG